MGTKAGLFLKRKRCSRTSYNKHSNWLQGLASTNQLSKVDFMVAGGFGGTAFWLACYPVDLVKSQIQVRTFS